MWFHQRTGPNSGVSISGGTLLIGLLILGMIVTKAWWLLLIVGVFWAIATWQHQTRHDPIPGYRDEDAAERAEQVRARRLENANPLAQNFHRRMAGGGD